MPLSGEGADRTAYAKCVGCDVLLLVFVYPRGCIGAPGAMDAAFRMALQEAVNRAHPRMKVCWQFTECMVREDCWAPGKAVSQLFK